MREKVSACSAPGNGGASRRIHHYLGELAGCTGCKGGPHRNMGPTPVPRIAVMSRGLTGLLALASYLGRMLGQICVSTTGFLWQTMLAFSHMARSSRPAVTGPLLFPQWLSSPGHLKVHLWCLVIADAEFSVSVS